jgi:hypothetical protein
MSVEWLEAVAYDFAVSAPTAAEGRSAAIRHGAGLRGPNGSIEVKIED